jgi:predicted nucleic acid-binding protein
MSADFIDSNVLLYLFDETDERKRTTAQQVVQGALATGSGVISFQVVQETLSVLTRKLGASSDDARRFLDAVLAPLWAVGPSTGLYASALAIRARYGFGFYDSLIVTAASAAGCSRLLSEDLQAGQVIDGLTVVNPFEGARTSDQDP